MENNLEETSKKKHSKLFIILFILLLIVGCIFLYIKGTEPYSVDSNDENVEETDKSTEEDIVENQDVEETSDKKILRFYLGSEDNSYNYSDSIPANENTKIIFTYNCKTDTCDVIKYLNNYFVVSDDELFVFDAKANKKYNDIVISKKNLNKTDISSFIVTDTSNNIKGLIIQDSTSAYYDVINNKYVIDFGVYDRITTNELSIQKGYLYVSKSEKDKDKLYLYSVKSNKVIKEDIGDAIQGKTKLYFTSIQTQSIDEPNILKIYSEDFKLIYDSKTNGEINYYETYANDEKIVIGNGKQFFVYDTNGSLKHTSKKYTKIYSILEDYVVVVKDGYVSIVDFNDNVKAKLEKYTGDTSIFPYEGKIAVTTYNGKKAVLVTDSNVSAKEEDTVASYKYYYIISTGKVITVKEPLE